MIISVTRFQLNALQINAIRGRTYSWISILLLVLLILLGVGCRSDSISNGEHCDQCRYIIHYRSFNKIYIVSYSLDDLIELSSPLSISDDRDKSKVERILNFNCNLDKEFSYNDIDVYLSIETIKDGSSPEYWIASPTLFYSSKSGHVCDMSNRKREEIKNIMNSLLIKAEE
ncbi:hypothetical protein [Pseudoxanthomonas broegbernensis]|uniref:hypothetical protein n=1 Tax=Pseudoxanthomonas broegbernensis TaxID=83619 RepID=UPI0013914F0C|nr:hypothetical protein [Pseudoxanthomonas broegbernensis]MBB6066415.1 hypothetical protein [Pseudoxanthomonas broegbernensis]